nr:PucR family transcriptional regulator [Fredinandcohnia onubensis]
MGIKVSEAIEICGLKHGTVVAGRNGLDKEIEHVSVIEIPDSHLYFKGSELFLTAFSHFSNNPSRQLMLLDHMNDAGSSALAILRTEKYISRLDPTVIEKADLLEIPIILFPEHIPYIDIISPILKANSMKESNQLSYLFHVQKELIDVLIRCQDLTEICLAASNILGNPICLVQPDFHFVAGDQTIYKHIQALIEDKFFKKKIEINYSGNFLFLNNNKVVFQPIFFESQIEGYLITIDQNIQFHEEHITALHHISLGLALKIQEERKITETMQIHKRNFYEDILTSRTITSMQLEKGYKLGIDLTLVSELLVVHTFNLEEFKDLPRKFNSVDYYFYAKKEQLIFLIKNTSEPCESIHRKIAEKVKELANEMIMIYSPLSTNCRNLADKYTEIEESIDMIKKVQFHNLYLSIDSLIFLRFIKEYRDNPSMKELVIKTIGSLIDYDREHQSDLLHTLETILFVEDTQLVLENLFIHRNTLMNRKRKIDSILGYNFEQFPYNLNVRLAVILWKFSS